MIDRQLQELGLSEHEAKVYGALLERSPLGAAAIAKACGLSRTTVYTVLGTLTGKGLVATTYKNEVKQFVTTGVDALTQRLQHERESLAAKERVLGDLAAHLATIRRDDLHVPRVQLFEGIEGLKRIYLAMLREAPPKSELLVLRSEFLWEPVWAFAWEEEWR
jgi:sugar-specific transcriptional regulator TrmB